MTGSLNPEKPFELFELLSARLQQRRVRGHVYIVGGAAMTLAFGRKRKRKAVDARIRKRGVEHAVMLEAAQEIADEQGLAKNWLEELATAFAPRGEDPRAPTLFDSPYLVVTGASAEHMLAMKLRAGGVADREDIAILVQYLGVKTTEEALNLHAGLFPETPVSRRAHAYLDEAIRNTPAKPKRQRAPRKL